MSEFLDIAILLRKTEYGDYDYILSYLSKKHGKITLIAKNAKKSVKRFQGTLELFNEVQITFKKGRTLHILKESDIETPFMNIRTSIKKTAYASYFAEIINNWLETDKKEKDIYKLFYYVLKTIDNGNLPVEVLSVFFQIRFMNLSGFAPNLKNCAVCGTKNLHNSKNIIFYMPKGGLVCDKCKYVIKNYKQTKKLSMGTIKQLILINSENYEKASRIRFTKDTLKESLSFLEKFLSFYLGKQSKSLSFISKTSLS